MISLSCMYLRLIKEDHYSSRFDSLMFSRTLVGLGTSFFKRASLFVSGVIQSSLSKPPVSPELGLIHQKKLSVISLAIK